MGPLLGIRVLDLSRVLAGPWATQALADLGAEVIKIERPDGGDDTRQWGPPYAQDASGRDTSESAYYLSTNRGKRSVAVDLARPDGAGLVRALAKRCDVLVENFKVGGLAKYGLAYQDLKADNPALVYCSISAFGQDGPDADKPGYDAMIQGMGGLMSITGLPDGEPGGGPQKVGVAVVDLMTGMYAATAITAALYERRSSGQGQYIDLALLDTQLGWLANQNMNFLVSGRSPRTQLFPYEWYDSPNLHFLTITDFEALVAKQGWTIEREMFLSGNEEVSWRPNLTAEIAVFLLKKPKARAAVADAH